MKGAAAGAALAAALAAQCPFVHAEVSAVPDGRGVPVATIEIFERDAQPWRYWTPVRAGVDPALLLNPEGDRYLDGPPSIVVHPGTGLPEAVWSCWDGHDYEIAWSRFDGSVWTTVPAPSGPDYVLLTDDLAQDRDPRLSIDAAGNRRVVWWIESDPVDRVVVAVLPAGDTLWLAPQTLSSPDAPTRRPDIVTVTSLGTFVVAEQDLDLALLVVAFEALFPAGDDTQRETEPWFKRGLQVVGPADTLSASLSILTAPEGSVPQANWRVGSWVARSAWDPESRTWCDPVLAPYQDW